MVSLTDQSTAAAALAERGGGRPARLPSGETQRLLGDPQPFGVKPGGPESQVSGLSLDTNKTFLLPRLS